MVEVTWEVEEAEAPRPVALAVTAWDRPGLLADVANAVSSANILNASARGYKDRTAVVNIKLEVRNLAQLNQIMDRIATLPYVLKVGRVSRERS
jgi:GTP pyrophosphokinase